ncbi:MAG: hypothetical protein CO128_01540 [Ignavibacteriales bacterium CG_4_9_14_3_um_filter_30_11]|nr:MAG: hypothetical protein CO128_01540 [Ignavibacteriales bacterium CG_4_9_14_3_um_filter_30_11]
MKIKIWHFIIFVLAVIILINIELLVNLFVMIFQSVVLLFTNYDQIILQLDFLFIDYTISTIFVFLLPIIILAYYGRIKIFQSKLNFFSAVVILLLCFTIFAPLTVSTDPNFQKDLMVTKLLPPFSTVQKLFLKQDVKIPKNSLDEFLMTRNLVIKKSYSDDFIYAENVNFDLNIVTYTQKDKEIKTETEKLLMINNNPVIESKLFLLGTDEYGRDILSRLIYGTRLSLFIGLGAVLVSFLIGIFLGFAAGYSGGFLDSILNRFTEMFLAFPILFLIIFIIAMFDSSILSIIFVLGISGWMSLFKIVRAEVIKLKTKDYFITAKLLGLSNYKLLAKEVLPNIISPVIVNLVFLYGNVILAEAALSFLGLGSGSNYPSWGGMIQAGQSYITIAWWMILFPGIMLFVSLLTANELGRKIEKHFNSRIQL